MSEDRVGARVILAILCADLVAGSLFIVGRAVVNGKAGIPPLIFTWLRYVLSTVLMHAWHVVESGLAPWRQLPRARDVWKYAAYGCCHVLGQVLIFSALQSVPAVVPSVWRNATPVLVCCLAASSGLEPFVLNKSGALKVGGVLIAIVGGLMYVALSTLGSRTDDAAVSTAYDYPRGQTLMLLATLATSSFHVMQKVCLNCERGVTHTVMWGLTFGCAALTAIVAPQLSARTFELRPAQWAYVAYAAAAPSAVGLFLAAWAMKQTSPVFVVAFDPVGTVIAAGLAWVALGEVPNLATCISASVIVVGLYLLVWGRRRELRSAGTAGLLQGEPAVVGPLCARNAVTE